MAKRLRNLDVREVSLVDKGANRKKFLITKSEKDQMAKKATKEELDQILKALDADALREDGKLEEVIKGMDVSPKATEALREALKQLLVVEEEMDGTECSYGLQYIMNTVATYLGWGVVGGETQEIEKNMGKENEAVKVDPKVEEISKSLAEVQKQLEESKKQNADMAEIIKREQDKAKTAEFVAKAEKEFKNLPGDAKSLGEVMKSLSEKAPEDFAKLEVVLKAANEMIAKGATLEVEGSKQGGEAGKASDEIYSQIEKKAEALVVKSATEGKPMSKAKAIDEVMKSEKALYTQYENAVAAEKRGN